MELYNLGKDIVAFTTDRTQGRDMDLIRETSGRILDSIVEKLREKEIRETGISLKESMADGKRQSIKSLLTEPMRENDRMDVLQKGGEVYR